jgi:hypothetical protein
MKRKRKLEADRAAASAAQVARLAGVSISRVYRLRQEGRTDGEIIAAAQRRKDEFVLRDVPPLPVDVETNGHAAGAGLSFAAAQTAEKSWSARLKELEYQERSGALIPISYVRHWGMRFLHEAKDLWLRGSSELRDQLAAESDPLACERIVEAFCERVVNTLYQMEKLWEPPPPPPGMAA